VSSTSAPLLATHANCLPVGTRVADFEIVGLIGEGGFGIVYLARDLSLDRVVALKEFMPSAFAGRVNGIQVAVRAVKQKNTFDAGLRGFINEARMLAKFSHPALVEVYRFWEENGTAYMAMRLYKGETLRQALATAEARFDENAIAQTMGPIFDALEMLHREQVFHRDIAPDNIMLTDGRPVLLDFGSARRIIGDGTQALTTVLKPGYAPIEQYSDDGTMKQGAWTDVYALGGVLYHLATGKVPMQAVSRMLSDPLQSVNEVTGGQFSAPFSDAVAKAMAVHVANRFQTVTEFRVALGWNVGTIPRVITIQHATVWLDPEVASADPVDGTPIKVDADPPGPKTLPPQLPPAKPAKNGVNASLEAEKHTSRRGLYVGAAAVSLVVGVLAYFLRLPVTTVAEPVAKVDVVVPAVQAVAAPSTALPPTPVSPEVVAPENTSPLVEGVVKFDIKPRGRIDIDGFARAVSPPVMELKLPVGKHTIDIVNPPSAPVTRIIDVTRDTPVSISHTFK
jgi:serine/threonine protein kinase